MKSAFLFSAALSPLLLSANEPVKLANPVQLQADGKVIDTRGHMTYAGPLYGDINDDGRPDLLVTTIRGEFLPYLNVSKKLGGEPVLSDTAKIPQDKVPPKLHNW